MRSIERAVRAVAATGKLTAVAAGSLAAVAVKSGCVGCRGLEPRLAAGRSKRAAVPAEEGSDE